MATRNDEGCNPWDHNNHSFIARLHGKCINWINCSISKHKPEKKHKLHSQEGRKQKIKLWNKSKYQYIFWHISWYLSTFAWVISHFNIETFCNQSFVWASVAFVVFSGCPYIDMSIRLYCCCINPFIHELLIFLQSAHAWEWVVFHSWSSQFDACLSEFIS